MIRAVEIADDEGNRSRHYLVEGKTVVPGFDGHFVITGWWDGDFALISPTITVPQSFAVKHGGLPRRGMAFTQCAATPCTVDAHGTVTLIDVPNAESWHGNTTHGWIGNSVGTYSSEAGGLTWIVFIQQPNGSFASVKVTARHAAFGEEAWLRAFTGPGEEAVVSVEGPGSAMVAISTNHGRTWQYRWGLGFSETLPSDWRSWPVAKDPSFTVSTFKPMR